MRLIDSNIIIYAAKDEFAYLRPLLLSEDVHVSVISKAETLGYHKLTEEERRFFESVFEVVPQLPIDQYVINIAVSLKQQRKYSLGDALIAATALHYNAELNTNNIVDFEKIEGIKLFNPIH